MTRAQNLGQKRAHGQNDLILASGEMSYLSLVSELANWKSYWLIIMFLQSSVPSFSACKPNAKPVLRRQSKALRYAGTFPKNRWSRFRGHFSETGRDKT